MISELWPSIPAVLRVMTGWFLLGIGLLDLAVELDGGLTGPYLVFHLALAIGGVLLLSSQRLSPSLAGHLAAAVLLLAAMTLTTLPDSATCCMADHPRRHGYPFPFLGLDGSIGGGFHLDLFYVAADLIFWGCAGLLLVVVLALAERLLPERRTPVDLTRFGGHAEPGTMSATPRHANENVGGLP